MSPAARAAELVRTHGLPPDALVVHAGGGGVPLLAELRRLGCRVLAVDPAGSPADGIDTLRTGLTATAARLVRDRYGPARVLVVAAAVAADAATICLAADGVVVLADAAAARPRAKAA